jgi:hypothetical protein
MSQERVRAGLARPKSEGKRLGRPRIPAELEERIRKTLATLEGPACVRSPPSSGLIRAPCSGLVAISRQALPTRETPALARACHLRQVVTLYSAATRVVAAM